jgi:MFS family permease
MATISVAKTMIGDLFVQQYPLIVTGAFTSACVMGFSVANLFGRLYWSYLSDRVGRPKIIKLFTLASVPLYLLIPCTVISLSYTTSPLPLVVFLACSSTIISFFGGIYSVCPAYESDLFGSKYFGAIHGRMLTASAFGAIVGPVVLARLRQYSEFSAMRDLAAKLDPSLFLERFCAPIYELE